MTAMTVMMGSSSPGWLSSDLDSLDCKKSWIDWGGSETESAGLCNTGRITEVRLEWTKAFLFLKFYPEISTI